MSLLQISGGTLGHRILGWVLIWRRVAHYHGSIKRSVLRVLLLLHKALGFGACILNCAIEQAFALRTLLSRVLFLNKGLGSALFVADDLISLT